MRKLLLLLSFLIFAMPAMANVKISDLPDGGQFEPGDQAPIVRDGANYKAAFPNLPAGNVGDVQRNAGGGLLDGFSLGATQGTGDTTNGVLLNNSGASTALSLGTVSGISNVVTPLNLAASALYQVSQGMEVDPRYYGAACNTQYFNSGYYGTDSTPHPVTTTAGSPDISISGYVFKNCIAAPGKDCDVGKVISIFGGDCGDVGPTTYIASVNTSTNKATLGINMTRSCTGGTGRATTIGGYPQSSCGVASSDPSLAKDDTCAIENASTAAAVHGGKVMLPPNCLVHNMHLAGGTILEGNSGGNTYGNSGYQSTATPLFFATNYYPEDPAIGIDFGSPGSRVPVTLRNIKFSCNIFPYIKFFRGAQFAAVGAETPMNLSPGSLLLDHNTFSLCPVGYGIPVGWNLPVTFTASISGTTMTVTAITSTGFHDKYGFSGGNTPDWLTLGRAVTGSGVSAGTKITAVPVGGGIGDYLINNPQTVASTTMTSQNPQVFLSGEGIFNAYVQNGFGINGDMSDYVDTGSIFTGNKITGAWIGPNTGGSTGNGANRFSLERFEENENNAAIVLDSSDGDTLTGVQGQFNSCGFLQLRGSMNDLQVTGGSSQGDGVINSQCADTTIPKAHIILSNSNSRNIQFNGVQFGKTDFAHGGTVSNLFATTTGAVDDYVSVEGGDVREGFGVSTTDFSLAAVAHYKQNAPGIASIDTTQSVLAVSTTGFISTPGPMAIGATTTNVAGTALNLLSNTTTANSSLGLPKGTAANRPTTPIEGMLRYNTDTKVVEIYNGSTWVAAGASINYYSFGGLGLSNDGALPNTVVDIASGSATSDDNTTNMVLSGGITKSTSAWAVGSGNGCLDSGSVAASTWYHLFLIQRTDTNVVDVLCSTSATSPTFPTNYTVKRRIGSVKTDGSSNILAFTQVGQSYYWATATLDVNTAALGTTAALQSLNVPPGVKVTPLCRYTMSKDGNSIILTSGDETDVAPTTANPMAAAPGADSIDTTIAAGVVNTICPYLTTNTSQQVRARSSAASTTLSIVTRGWID